MEITLQPMRERFRQFNALTHKVLDELYEINAKTKAKNRQRKAALRKEKETAR